MVHAPFGGLIPRRTPFLSCKYGAGMTRRNDPVHRTDGEGRGGGYRHLSKKILGVASLLLGLFAWLGEKFGLVTRRTADWANFGSAVTGAIVAFA